MTTLASHRARWKRVEKRVAEILSGLFSDVGHKSVERIPILGRTGPDLSYNDDLKLIIDVKSRQEVPKSTIAPQGKLLDFGDMVGFRLTDIQNLADLSPVTATPSRLVAEWLSHMDEWTTEHEPDGISCVVAHRPGMPVGDSAVIIYSKERNTLCQKIQSS
jgi:hypothetical protein